MTPLFTKGMNEEVQPAPSAASPLYLRLSDSRLCFARYDKQQRNGFSFFSYKLRPQASLTINLREAKEAVPMLQAPAPATVVLVSSPITLVPLAEFQEEDSETIYNYCFPADRPRRVFYDIVPETHAVLMFAVDEQVGADLEEFFQNVRFTASLTPLLRRFANKGNLGNASKRIFICRHERSIDLAAFEDNRLIMVNSYPTLNETDAVYYTCNVAQHLGIAAETAPFYVAGDPDARERLISALRPFAPQVRGINPTAEFNRHIISTTEGVPYDLMSLLIE